MVPIEIHNAADDRQTAMWKGRLMQLHWWPFNSKSVADVLRVTEFKCAKYGQVNSCWVLGEKPNVCTIFSVNGQLPKNFNSLPAHSATIVEWLRRWTRNLASRVRFPGHPTISTWTSTGFVSCLPSYSTAWRWDIHVCLASNKKQTFIYFSYLFFFI